MREFSQMQKVNRFFSSMDTVLIQIHAIKESSTGGVRNGIKVAKLDVRQLMDE